MFSTHNLKSKILGRDTYQTLCRRSHFLVKNRGARAILEEPQIVVPSK
jgi:hypothetical protein